MSKKKKALDERGSWLRYRCYACGHRLALASTACPQCGEEFHGHIIQDIPQVCACSRCVGADAETQDASELTALRAQVASLEAELTGLSKDYGIQLEQSNQYERQVASLTQERDKHLVEMVRLDKHGLRTMLLKALRDELRTTGKIA